MPHDVFISYSSRDKAVADAICAALENQRIRCWIAPRDVLAGIPYGESLIKALNASRIMVLVFSSSANTSPQVLREMERAVSKNIPIIPFRIEDVPLSEAMEYFISSPHWLDALTPPLEKHIQTLADTVQVLLSRTPAPAPVEQPATPGAKASPGGDPRALGGGVHGSRRRAGLAGVKSLRYAAILIGVCAAVGLVWLVTRSKSRQADEASRPGNASHRPQVTNPTTSATLAPGNAEDISAPQIREADVPELPSALTLGGHLRHALAVAFAPDAKTLVSGGDDTPDESAVQVKTDLFNSLSAGTRNVGAVRLWNSQTGEAKWILWGPPGPVTSVAFSADGKTVTAGGSDQTVRVWSVETGTAQRPFNESGTSAVRSIALSRDGSWLACGLSNATITLWNARTGELKRTLAGHKDEVTAVAFSHDSATLASASRDRTAFLWDVQTGDLRHTLSGHNSTVTAVDFSKEPQRVATGSADRRVMIWDAQSGKRQLILAGHRAEVVSVSFSADGKLLASASDDGRVLIWDAQGGGPKRKLTEHGGKVACVTFSPVGNTLATASWDKTVKLWRVE